MWKALKDATKAIGMAREKLVKVHNRIDQAGKHAPTEAAAAQTAVEEVEHWIAKAVEAIQEIYASFRMRETWPSCSRSVYRVQTGDNGTSAPPPTQEPGGGGRAGESRPNVSPVPRPVPRPSRSGGNERRAPDEQGGGCATVDFSLSAKSFSYGRVAGLHD